MAAATYMLNGQMVDAKTYKQYKAYKADKYARKPATNPANKINTNPLGNVTGQTVTYFGSSGGYVETPGYNTDPASMASPLLYPSTSPAQAAYGAPAWDLNGGAPAGGPTDAYGRPSHDASGHVLPLAMSAGGTREQHKAKSAANAARAKAGQSGIQNFIETPAVKWTLIGGGVLIGGYLLYSMFHPRKSVLQRGADAVTKIHGAIKSAVA